MLMRDADASDLSDIVKRPAVRMLSEYENVGVDLPWVENYFAELIAAGSAKTFADEHGHCFAILGLEPVDDAMNTSFIAEEAFFTGADIWFQRKAIASLQQQIGNPLLRSHSYSEHPKVERWFRALGFTLEATDDLHRVFVRPPQLFSS